MGEQLQIPTNESDNQRIPSPTPSGTKSVPFGSSTSLKGPQHSRPPSPTKTAPSNEKAVNGDFIPSSSRKGSTSSQQPTHFTDEKPPSRRDSTTEIPPVSSKRESTVIEQPVSSRRSSFTGEQKPSSPKDSTIIDQETSSRPGSVTSLRRSPSIHESSPPQEKPFSRRESAAVEEKPASRRESGAIVEKPVSRRESGAIVEKPVSRRESGAIVEKPASRRESGAIVEKPASRRESGAIEEKPSSGRESPVVEEKPASRRESGAIEEKPASRRASGAVEEKPSSRRESTTVEEKPASRRESQAIEEKSSSRRESAATEQKPPSRRESAAIEQKPSSRRESAATEQKPSSRRESSTIDDKPSSRRESTTIEHKPVSRKGSASFEQPTDTKRESVHDDQKPSSRRESTAVEKKPSSRRESAAIEKKPSSRKESFTSEQLTSDHREATTDEEYFPDRRKSTAIEHKPSSRKGSEILEQKTPSKRGSIAQEQSSSSRQESIASEQKPYSRKASVTSDEKPSSKRGSLTHEPQILSQRGSVADEQKQASRKGSYVAEQPSSSRRASQILDKLSQHRSSISDQQEQKAPSKPASRKASTIDDHQISTHYDNHQPIASSRRTSADADNQLISSSRSYTNNVTPSKDSSRRSSTMKNEQQSTPVFNNKDSRRSSYKGVPTPDTDVPAKTSAKHKSDGTPSYDKRLKSSSSTDEKDKSSSFKQRSGQQSKRNSNLITDETIVTPLFIDFEQDRRHSRGRTPTNEDENGLASKLPPVNSFYQHDKPRRSETLNKQKLPTSKRAESKQLSSSHATSQSEDEQASHWTKKIPIPSIHLTDDDELSTPREDQPRPQSPNVEQIAERNQQQPPPQLSAPITTLTGKKRIATDGQKRKDRPRLSRRSTSAESVTHIRLVDDDSLDSTSENNINFERYKRRHPKPKQKDVETNTDEPYESPHQQQEQEQEQEQEQKPEQQQKRLSYFDDEETNSQKPLKAKTPMSDHLNPPRRRPSTKNQSLSTTDTIPEAETPTVRRSVKQTKLSTDDKDPVNVNVTVVVKKFAGTGNDGSARTIAEAYIEQKPEQYFEPAPQPLQAPVPSSPANDKDIREEPIERPKTAERKHSIKPVEPNVEHHDRHTQSDTEQIMTEQQKKRRRPKRISRTCQTYECVFRRMEREQQQTMRSTSDTEKNMQTRKSHLRPRKKSPRKNPQLYLSADSFRIEELLPKQYHQSRRNASKSSSIGRSMSPQGGKLLILRPTLPFHHTDAVNVQRVCLQYAIDLIPNNQTGQVTTLANQNKLTVQKQPEPTSILPLLGSSSGSYAPSNKSHAKEKSASHKSDDSSQQRRNNGAF